jgi:hypothetical protein
VYYTQQMLIIDGQSLKVAPVNSKCAPSLLPTLVTSAALKHASQRFATQESVDPVVQQIKSICVLQGEFAEVDLTQVTPLAPASPWVCALSRGQRVDFQALFLSALCRNG